MERGQSRFFLETRPRVTVTDQPITTNQRESRGPVPYNDRPVDHDHLVTLLYLVSKWARETIRYAA